MAIREIEKPKRKFTVLIGCNTSDDTRYEIGDPMFEDQVKPADIDELIEAGAIEECQ